MTEGELAFVDLPGSNFAATLARVGDAGESLRAIGSAVRAVREGKAYVAPRSIKSIQLLRQSFRRDSRVALIIHLPPPSEIGATDEICRSMEYASRILADRRDHGERLLLS